MAAVLTLQVCRQSCVPSGECCVSLVTLMLRPAEAFCTRTVGFCALTQKRSSRFTTKTADRNPALETCHDKTGGVKQDQIIPSLASCGFSESFVSLLDKDGVLLLVVVQAEAVAGAEGDQFPLGVQGESGDHGGGLALDQGEGLEAWREQDRLLPHVQPSVALRSTTANNWLSVWLRSR